MSLPYTYLLNQVNARLL